MLSGRRKKDYAAQTAAEALATQAEMMGLEPVDADDFDSLDDEVVDETAEDALDEESAEPEPVAA